MNMNLSETQPPDRCLICYSKIHANSRLKRSSSCGKEAPSLLHKQLGSVFILRKLLEIPVEHLQTFLMSWGNPEKWISICSKCNTIVKEAENVYDELVDINKRFRMVKKKVIEAIKKSKAEQDKEMSVDFWKVPNRLITDQSRNFVSIYDYGYFTDPFILGDREASELVKNGPTFRNKRLDSQNVKVEVDNNFTEEYFDEDASLFDIDYHDQNMELESSDAIDVFSNNVDMQPMSVEDPAKDSSKSFAEGLEPKYCTLCGLNFLEKMFAAHIENFHKTGNPDVPEDPLKQTVEEEQVSGMTTCKNDDSKCPQDNTSLSNKAVKNKSTSKALLCAICPRKLYRQKDLFEHQDLHKTSPFHCYVCKSVHMSVDNLRYHLWKNHPSTRQGKTKPRKPILINITETGVILGPAKSSATLATATRNIKCLRCTLYIPPSKLDEHMELHEKSPHHCTHCGNVFITDRKLRLHSLKYHRHLTNLKNKRSGASNSKILDSRTKTRRISLKRESVNSDSDTVDSDTDNKLMDDIDQDPDWSPQNESVAIPSNSSVDINEREARRTLQYEERLAWNCPLCSNFRFKIRQADTLLNHWETCAGVRANMNEESSEGLNCPLCNNFKVTISERVAFSEHLLICNGKLKDNQLVTVSKRIFDCNLCVPKKYFQLNGFVQHFVEHKKNVYKCIKCPKRFSTTSNVQSHWKNVHRDSMISVKPLYRFLKETKTPDISWWCNICSQKFTKEDDREAHIYNDHEQDVPQKLHICQECSIPYACKDELRLHKGISHTPIEVNGVKGSYPCDLCKNRFTTERQLKNHKMKIHRIDLLVCDTCGTECNSSFNLRLHMELHKDVKRFVCTECKKSFTIKAYLTNHILREHTSHDAKLNPLVCQYCEKAFYNKYYLNEHVKGVHQGVFKMHCNLCNAGFHNNTKLKMHLARKHNIGEAKRHPCTIKGCTKTFGSLDRLKCHLARHQGNPQFKCRFCEKEFYHRNHWRRHEQIHTNSESKPYQCEICAKSFPVRNYLYIHMKSHKKENN